MRARVTPPHTDAITNDPGASTNQHKMCAPHAHSKSGWAAISCAQYLGAGVRLSWSICRRTAGVDVDDDMNHGSVEPHVCASEKGLLCVHRYVNIYACRMRTSSMRDAHYAHAAQSTPFIDCARAFPRNFPLLN